MIRDWLARIFNRYTVVALWVTPTGVSTQHIKMFGHDAAMNTADSLRFQGQGYCIVCVIGPHGGLV